MQNLNRKRPIGGKVYFRKFLKVAPLALAIWRGIEAYQLSRNSVKYKRPILDIGCGFGEFAGVFYDHAVEVGIDIDDRDLLKARQIKKFKNLIVADARKLPFSNNSFNTIISNSVLEHIPLVHKVFEESYRVLKPGGYLIFTVAIDTLYNNLFLTSLFEKLGIRPLGFLYYRAFNKIFHHINAFPKDKWITMVKKEGFTIIDQKEIISARSTRIFDLTLLFALPSQLCRWFFRKRWIFNFPGRIWLLEKIFGQFIAEEANIGSNLLIIEKKK